MIISAQTSTACRITGRTTKSVVNPAAEKAMNLIYAVRTQNMPTRRVDESHDERIN